MIPMVFLIPAPVPETLKQGSIALYETRLSTISSPMAKSSRPTISFQCLCLTAETAMSEHPSFRPVSGQDEQAEHYPVISKPRKIML